MILVNVKLDVNGYKRILFQSSFLMAILAFLYCGEIVKNSTDSLSQLSKQKLSTSSQHIFNFLFRVLVTKLINAHYVLLFKSIIDGFKS